MPVATSDSARPRPPVTLTVGGLEVVFEWTRDRWRHRVSHAGRPLAESVEGDGPAGDPRWPASPPLQEVAAEGTDGRRAVLAVGSAGRSHYSVSITADPTRPDTVLVEAACRIRDPAGWLGSTYRLAGGGLAQIEAADGDGLPRTVVWSYRVGPEGVTASPADAFLSLPGAPLRSAPASITFRDGSA